MTVICIIVSTISISHMFAVIFVPTHTHQRRSLKRGHVLKLTFLGFCFNQFILPHAVNL